MLLCDEDGVSEGVIVAGCSSGFLGSFSGDTMTL